MSDSAPEFDITAHQRERIRDLERHNKALEVVRRRLERLLAIAVRAAAGPDCDPHVLLRVIERLDELADQPGIDHDQLAQILRDTDPARLNGVKAA